MGKLVSLSINIDKVDMSRVVQGKNGRYLNLTVSLNDQVDQYGNNVNTWQQQTKEEREAKADRNFLGNGRVVYDSQTGAGTPPPQQQYGQQQDEVLPF